MRHMTEAGDPQPGTPEVRHAVRVLLLDDDDRLFLFRGVSPETGEVFWFPAGGGIEDGEDARQAAAREVEEETGVAGLEVGAEVWHRRYVFPWLGRVVDQRERWFLARVGHFEVDDTRWTVEERLYLTSSRWWSADELATTTERLVPRDLAARLRAVLDDGPPAEPAPIGE